MGEAWKSVIPPEDLAAYEAAGYGRPGARGERPAVLVIDVTYGFIGREPLPLLESIRRYPNSCGQAGWDALRPIEAILSSARGQNLPIYYTAGLTSDLAEHAGRWREKHPSTLDQPEDAQVIPDEIAPEPGDLVIRKTKPSVFFGTPLVASLVDRAIDTLIVTGCTTSGCVRATVVDAFSYGFSTIVVEDAVFDRGQLSHKVNLFDMHQKYADVMPSDQVLSFLAASRVGAPTRGQ